MGNTNDYFYFYSCIGTRQLGNENLTINIYYDFFFIHSFYF